MECRCGKRIDNGHGPKQFFEKSWNLVFRHSEPGTRHDFKEVEETIFDDEIYITETFKEENSTCA